MGNHSPFFVTCVNIVVPRERINSADTRIFVNENVLSGVTSASFEKSYDAKSLRGLNSLHITDKITQEDPTATLSLSWNMGGGLNDPFFQFQNSGLISTETFSFKIQDTVGSNVFSGCYLTSYKLNASVGDLVKGEVSYEVDHHFFDTGDIWDNILNPKTGFQSHIFIPANIEITSFFANQEISTNKLNIQSFSLDAPISRKKVVRLGERIPQIRYPEFPLEGDLQFSVLKNDITGLTGAILVETGSIDIYLNDCDNSHQTRFLLNECRLDSASESLDLDGNAQIDFSYKFNMGSGDITVISEVL